VAIKPRIFLRLHSPEVGDAMFLDAETIQHVFPEGRDAMSRLIARVELTNRDPVLTREDPEQVMVALLDALTHGSETTP
jgi:hypothetical protein